MEKYVLYGAGEYGKAAYHYLSSRGGQICCWIDGDTNKQGLKLFGLPILSLEEWLIKRDNSHIIITVGSRFVGAITSLLHKHGITDYELFDRTQLYHRERLVSYCSPKDCEDIILYPVLEEICPEKIFYIDVGSNDPCLNSVTKLYYDRGAHGINVDALQEFINLSTKERVRDINVCTGISDKPGETIIYLDGGGSTMRNDYSRDCVYFGERRVRLDTLAHVCAKYVPSGQDVHLLKIDVEGFEHKAIRGMDWELCRPWILCIESTLPHTDVPSITQFNCQYASMTLVPCSYGFA